MKSHVRLLIPFLAAALGAGCVVSIGGGPSKAPRETPAPPPPIVVPGAPADAATLAEIDAAAKLSFDSGRVDALKRVAARPSLSPAAQVHLVNTSLRVLSFDNARVDVLRTLIDNPAFAPPAREAIFRQIELLEFDSNRSTIIQAVQARTGGA